MPRNPPAERSALEVRTRPFRPTGATRREGAARLAASPPRDWQLGRGGAARGERRGARASHAGARDESDEREGGRSAGSAGADARERSVAGGCRGRGFGRRARIATPAFGADSAAPSGDHPRQPQGAGRHPQHVPRHGQSALHLAAAQAATHRSRGPPTGAGSPSGSKRRSALTARMPKRGCGDVLGAHPS